MNKKEEWQKKREEMKKQEPTETIHIEGVGTVKVYGKLDMEKFIKRMLESKAITG